jgi:hypothetical protein
MSFEYAANTYLPMADADIAINTTGINDTGSLLPAKKATTIQVGMVNIGFALSRKTVKNISAIVAISINLFTVKDLKFSLS